jgi:hypothetical protein
MPDWVWGMVAIAAAVVVPPIVLMFLFWDSVNRNDHGLDGWW